MLRMPVATRVLLCGPVVRARGVWRTSACIAGGGSIASMAAMRSEADGAAAAGGWGSAWCGGTSQTLHSSVGS